ncbi:uncharacterized protein LOC106673894 [Cimex lectularius]|uniref:Chitin-binding type-2 domain-containing protein n=1 Tax=Cimex lectularius TaxID=79782 RepID=A0A8I6TKR2_CIMLE|nr:uncharacterized protein LOC106673894 [Cimex lectularius]
MTLAWVAFLFLVAATGSDAVCEGDEPTAALLCHVESVLHPSIDPCHCTHMVVHDKGLLKDVQLLKEKNPRLKVLAVEDSSKAELSKGLDGIYINLEKPPLKEKLVEDFKALSESLHKIESTKRAKAKFDGGKQDTANYGNEIIMELPAEPQQLAKHYDLKALTKYVNYFVVPSYNLTDSTEDGLAYHPSRLMGIDDILNADSLIDFFSGMGADHSQMILSLPAFALHFNLKDAAQNMPRSSVLSAPKKISQAQLCKMMDEGGWTLERDEDLTAPYAYKGTDWVAFDDSISASIKGKYALLRNLAGISIASSESDDWEKSCSGKPITDTLYNTFTQLSRKSRAAQLLSLQDQIHNSLTPFSGDVHLSPFRIVRVVDRSGSVHVVRKEAKTEFECTRQGYFTHPSGCNRFYRCVKFNQYSPDFTVFEYDCPAGLAFDERYEVCVWPGSLPDASACKGSSEIAPVPRSRYACSSEGYFADPENCRWFFACLDHHRDGKTPPTAYEFRCPFGLVFDGNSLVCDWPWKVPGCSSGSTSFSTFGSGTLYPGDILEGRLRPAYAQVSDVHVSGGRIQGVDGGHVLGTTLLSGVASQTQGTYPGSGYSAFGSLSGVGQPGYFGGSNSDNSGAYVHDPTGDSGGEYVHQDVPYVHREGDQVPYLHQGDSGAYVHQSDSGNYKGSGAYSQQGDSGRYKGSEGYAQEGDNGVYVHQGDRGSYRGSGGYAQQGDNGAYVHQGVPYVHQEGGQSPYVHQGDSGRYKGSGTYVQAGGGGSGAYNPQGDSGSYKGSGTYVQTGGVGGVVFGPQGDGGSYKGSGTYVQQGDSGAYVHQDVPYVHQEGEQSPYVHQGDSGSYRGSGTYVQTGGGGSGAYSPQGDSGSYKGSGSYVQTGGGGGVVFGPQGDRGSYKGSGTYVQQGDSGAYVHQDVPYVHQEGDQRPYVHQGDSGSYKGSGTYVQTGGSGSVAFVPKGSGSYPSQGLGDKYKGSGEYYVSTGDYYPNSLFGGNVFVSKATGVNVGGGGSAGEGAYVHDPTGDNGGQYVHDGREYVTGLSKYSSDVKTGGSFTPGTLTGGFVPGTSLAGVKTGTFYTSGAGVGLNSGAYVHDNKGSYDVKTGGNFVVTGLDNGAYVHDSRGDFGGEYVPGFGGAYRFDNTGNYRGSFYGGKYAVGQGSPQYVTNLYKGTDQYGNGAYVHDARGDYGGGYYQSGYKLSAPVNTFGLRVNQAHLYQPASAVVHSYGPTKFSVQDQGYVQHSVSVAPITVTSAPVVPLKPVQYLQPHVSPVVVTTPAPQIVGYHYQKTPTVSPVTVTSAPVVPLNPVQYVKTPQPVVHKFQPVVVSTPAPPVVNYSYKQPVVSTVKPFTVSSTVAYSPSSTPAPPVLSYHQPTVVKTEHLQPVVGYSYSKPELHLSSLNQVNTYGTRFVNAGPSVVHFEHPVVSTPSPPVSYTFKPITVSSTPVVPLNPVQYNVKYPQPASVPCKTCAVAQTPKPLTVTPSPVVHTDYNYFQPAVQSETTFVQFPQSYAGGVSLKKPVCTSCASAQTARPVTVTSRPVVPLNPVQYVQPVQVSTPSPPVVSYTYQKPVYKTQPLQPTFVVSTPAPNVHYQHPQNSLGTAFKYQPFVETQTVRPVSVFSTPVVPYNPVQYTPVRPAVEYHQTVVKDSFGYSYPQPAVKFELPEFKTVHHVTTPQPSVAPVSFSNVPVVQTQTVRPFVSTTPVVPYNPVQYVKTAEVKPVVAYHQPQPFKPVAVSPPSLTVSYSSPAVKTQTERPVSYNYQPVRTETYVSTPAPPVVSYQPFVKTQTVSPVVPVVTSRPVVPLNPVQYVKPLEPKPVFSYSYVKPQTVHTYSVSTPAPPSVSYSYQPAVKTVSTPAPPVVNYQSYVKKQTVRPVVPVVTSKPVVPLNPVQYVKPLEPRPVFSYNYVQPQTVHTYSVSTPAPPSVSYSYLPAVKTVSTPAPPVVNYQSYVKTQTLRPVVPVVTSKPVVPLNPVQYVKPLEPKPVFSYNYVQPQTVHTYSVSTPAPPSVSYSYQPAVKTVSTPAPPSVSYSYQPAVKTFTTPAPPAVSYQPFVKTQTVSPVVHVPSVQYAQPLKPKTVFSYSYVKPQTVNTYSVSTPAPPSVSYSYQPAVKTVSTPAPPSVSYSYQPAVKTVTTPATPVVSYQPFVKTQTVRPVVPFVTSQPSVPLNPVQYVKTFDAKPVLNYNFVQPKPLQTVSVSTQAPPVVSYSYQPAVTSQTVRPVTVTSTTQLPYEPVRYGSQDSKLAFGYRYEKPKQFVSPSFHSLYNGFVEYGKPESKPTYSFSYVNPEPAVFKVPTTPRPAVRVSTTPAVPFSSVQYVEPSKPSSFGFSFESPSVHKDYYYGGKVVPFVTSTEVPFVEHKLVRVRPAGFQAVVSSDKPESYFEEYFESQKHLDAAPKGQYFSSSFSSQGNTGYKYDKPAVQLEENLNFPGIKVNQGFDNTYKQEVPSSSFAPIVVPEVSTTVRTFVKKPVQTYVNTVEEENYFTSSVVPALGYQESGQFDVPKSGVQLSSSTPEQVVEVTTVAPVVKRVRVKGGSSEGGGYYVRKQKVRVKPVVTTENYPDFVTSTVRPFYSTTFEPTAPALVLTSFTPTGSVAGTELEIEGEEDDAKLLKAVSGSYGEVVSSGDKGVLRQGLSSTTISSLKDGEAIVGVIKKEREPLTGRKKSKVVVVSRLSDFNPILVGKLGAECSCKSNTKTLDLSKNSRTRGGLFTPSTTLAEPSREYLPSSSTPLPADLTNFDYDDASAPTVEIKPVHKVQRVFTTTGQPLDVSSVEYEVSTTSPRKVSSVSSRRTLTNTLDVDCQRPGLFRHPHLCNKFYSCNWDEWKKRYTVNVFDCPIHLAFDSKLGACNWPSKGPKCAENNLLV